MHFKYILTFICHFVMIFKQNIAYLCGVVIIHVRFSFRFFIGKVCKLILMPTDGYCSAFFLATWLSRYSRG